MKVLDAVNSLFCFDSQELQFELTKIKDVEWELVSQSRQPQEIWAITFFEGKNNLCDEHNLVHKKGIGELGRNFTKLQKCTYYQKVMNHFKCHINKARLIKCGASKITMASASQKNGDVRIIIPVQSSPQASCYVNGKLINMQLGEVWLTDIRFSQKLENKGNEPWVYLEFDCVLNEWLSDQIKMANETARMIDFLHEIGIQTSIEKIDEDTFLPGLKIYQGMILIDKQKLKYPGDILHEAGHIAVVPEERRKMLNGDVSEGTDQFQSEEMAANLWSFAALKKLGIPVEMVFHESAYKTTGKWFIDNYEAGNYIGLPLLEWKGMAAGEEKAQKTGVPPFPEMINWLQ